ncbi:MAG: hypothetical protein ABI091_22155, partial [Ferruginibacter sp.]
MKKDREYQICTKTVMDTSDPEIRFDENGICNYYYEYHAKADKLLVPIAQRKVKFDQIINEIKEEGKSKDYDCLIGLSGGVDSSYIAYLAG